MPKMKFFLKSIFGFICCLSIVQSVSIDCDRKPRTTNLPKRHGDNGYKIEISGNPAKYVAGDVYTVTLKGWRTPYSVQKFVGFMLVAQASRKAPDAYGHPSVGIFQLYGDALTMHSENCPNSVTSTNSMPKSEIQVMWTAPPAGSGCVVFRSTVVEQRDIWYMDDGELTKELCEEVQENDDMQPEVIQQCCACDEAKYEVTFEGLWSRHTHPKDFPDNEWLTHFSDIIGASHSAGYRVWEYNGYASPGLRQVAEWGSTRTLEGELKRESKHIRTIIKARGLWHPNLNNKTFAVFRVDNEHHLMSLVSMLGPSPDWLVGVSALELCLKNCSWLGEKTLNLYPWDAGTDSGITYNAANMPSVPRQKIRRITTSHPNDPDSPFYDPTGTPMKPLARLTIKRQRVYEKSCTDTTQFLEEINSVLVQEDDDVNRPECLVEEWSAWSQCSVSCGNGLRSRRRGYRMPMKADMLGCRRQMQEKEMCSGDVPICDGGTHSNVNGWPEEDSDYCATTEWSNFSPCSGKCGETMVRSRRYINYMDWKRCSKELMQEKDCPAGPECSNYNAELEEEDPKCLTTPWSKWSPCTASCGTGVHIRTRNYLIPGAEHSSCSKELQENRQCEGLRAQCGLSMIDAQRVCVMDVDVGHCRGYHPRWYYNSTRQMCIQFTFGGCKGNANNFKTYDECAKSCEFLNNGNAIIGSTAAQVAPPSNPSNLYQLPGPVRNQRGPVKNCVLSDWSAFGPCFPSCGRKSFRKATRTILMRPQNGGKPCPKKLEKRQKCRRMPKCDFGSLTAESHHINEETREMPRTNIFRNNEPIIEGNTPGLFKVPGTVNVLPPPPPFEEERFDHIEEIQDPQPIPEGCRIGPWGPWSPCTHTCGLEAIQQRVRQVMPPSDLPNAFCGARIERRYCSGLPDCPRVRG